MGGMACALVLLLFAVSLSDDLHYSENFLADDCSATRRHSMGSGFSHHSPESARAVTTPVAAVLPFPASSGPLRLAALTASAGEQVQTFLFSNHVSGRAPPVSRL
jgi:hypothetical protein